VRSLAPRLFCPLLTWDGREYLPELQKARRRRDKSLQEVKEDSMNRLLSDLAIDRERNPAAAALDRWDPDEEGEDDDGDINIIDRSKFTFLFAGGSTLWLSFYF